MANEAVKYVWEGAIPLQIHLHKSDVASHPAPPPALVIILLLDTSSFFLMVWVLEISGVWCWIMIEFGFCFLFFLNHPISIIKLFVCLKRGRI